MTKVRQDAWSSKEDEVLAQVVLKHIREGSTQLRAFEEVGSIYSRSAAACGFRWNSFVRKQYKKEIEQAKKQRKKKHQDLYQTRHSIETPEFSFEEIINYLNKLYNEHIDLQNKYESLYASYLKQQEKYKKINREYEEILTFLEKASKIHN
ncbi:RsfA family transcriptional regulator [Heyndrickxia camelliae]|uniref:RsfA family transcriptional regulator n=1 Tax=Heyndrickxia camelliae TaxID=1707093 RepID=A0A2N3LD03_9BACI|nr:RsfA family transcriptional regulator [Heyndrickxia camelliae]PKR82491.1 RsfA family transcriptional regulator [Heyndrickxia camelliae]